jgi:heme-degrading monooxygenase HmoA
MQQTLTISFFRYKGLANKFWGMSQMYLAREPMQKMAGLEFFKPLGTGSGAGYSIIPDFSVYGILAVWEDVSYAEAFLNSNLFADFKKHSSEQYTIFMQPILAKGSWSGFENWRPAQNNQQNTAVAVITYATIRKGFIIPFLRITPKVSRVSEQFAGLIFSKGIGEMPVIEQATFTVWQSVSEMEQFAYRSQHIEAMKLTRQKNGFAEQLFARFNPIKAIGTYRGKNPVQELLDAQNRK